MDEQHPGGGGPANTPPFPRLVSDDDILERRLRPDSDGAFASDADTPDRLHVVAEAVARPEIRKPTLDTSSDAGSRSGEEPDLAAETRPGEGFAEEEVNDFAADAADQIRKVTRSVNRGFESLANQLDDAAARLDNVAESHLRAIGSTGRVADAAHSTAGAMENAAEYLRSRDVRAMQRDLEHQVREQPLRTLLFAAGAGWMVGKIMR